MNPINWPSSTTRIPETRVTTRPAPARRDLSFFLLLLTIFLPASLVEAQAPNPRASAAAAIAAQRLQVPEAELQVLNEVQVGDINSLKVLNSRTGNIEVVNLDDKNREVPRERVEQVLANRRQAGFRGKQEKELAEKVAGRPATELTTVVVWVRLPGPPPRLERPGASGAGPTVSAEAYREFHRNTTHGLVEQARARGWTVVYQSQETPIVILKVPNGEMQALEARGDVDAIYLAREGRPELNVSAAAIDAPKVWQRGYTGVGVKVAIVEQGAIYFDHVDLPDGTYCNPLTVSPVSDHPTLSAGIIASTNATYKGIARGIDPLLSGNAPTTSDADIIACTDWALAQGANVINYSFGVPTQYRNQFGPQDRYADYIVRNRGVTVVKSAGNMPSPGFTGTCWDPDYSVTTPGKGYNVLTVGAYDDKGDSDNANDVMHTTSCWGDPYSVYGDREKPEVVAPGTAITSTFCTGPNTCTGTTSGTSFAAPHVSGCAALLMSRKSDLKLWPEAVRAVLMASAVTNIEGYTRLSEKDGVGAIECDSADDILTGAAGGEQHISVSGTSFPMNLTFSATAGNTVRAVIAWDSNPSTPVSSGTAPASDPLQADLELTIYGPDGAFVIGSSSYDNSFEIAEFKASTTGTYTARVTARRFEGANEFLAFAWWQGTPERIYSQ